jgi:hypothetical protein
MSASSLLSTTIKFGEVKFFVNRGISEKTLRGRFEGMSDFVEETKDFNGFLSNCSSKNPNGMRG